MVIVAILKLYGRPNWRDIEKQVFFIFLNLAWNKIL